MRIPLRILIATTAVISSAAAATAETATAVAPVGPAQSSQTAVWEPRTLKNFGSSTLASCEGITRYLRAHLIELGARAGDIRIDERACYGVPGGNVETKFRSVDATFSVLVPANKSNGKARGEIVEARWQIVEMRPGEVRGGKEFGGFESCTNLKYVTQTILPLFSARDVKLISNAVCNKTGVGLRAEVLTPMQQ